MATRSHLWQPVTRHRRWVLFGLLPVVAALSLVPVSLFSAGAQSPTNGVALAQQYLSALGPASSAINVAEAKLKALPITATVAQVSAIVAPLPSAIRPVLALSQAAALPSPSGTSLESLGAPSSQNAKCATYRTAAAGANIVVGGHLYQTGFQLTVTSRCSTGDYTWQIGNRYTSFSAEVALDLASSCKLGQVRFLGTSGASLPVIQKNGTIIERIGLGPDFRALGNVHISHQSSLTVQVIPICNRQIVVDVMNDRLT